MRGSRREVRVVIDAGPLADLVVERKGRPLLPKLSRRPLAAAPPMPVHPAHPTALAISLSPAGGDGMAAEAGTRGRLGGLRGRPGAGVR